MKQKLLMVGGPAAGRWITVDRNVVAIPVAEPIADNDPTGWSLTQRFDRAVYVTKAMMLFNRKIWVLVYSKEPDENKAITDALFNDVGKHLWAEGEPR